MFGQCKSIYFRWWLMLLILFVLNILYRFVSVDEIIAPIVDSMIDLVWNWILTYQGHHIEKKPDRIDTSIIWSVVFHFKVTLATLMLCLFVKYIIKCKRYFNCFLRFFKDQHFFAIHLHVLTSLSSLYHIANPKHYICWSQTKTHIIS